LVFGGPEQPQAMPNPKANGNAWFVSDLKFVESPNQKSKQSEPSTAKKPLLFPQMIRNISRKTCSGRFYSFINLTKYQPNELEFKSSQDSSIGSFSEIYYPHGWKFFIDEKEVPYIKADYLLRAVHVPAGNHNENGL
jgi:hypothetical protein